MPSPKRLRLYSPHPAQLALHQSTKRFKVWVAGRQVGKSTMALNELSRRAWENPGTRYWFISPIYSQAKDQYLKLRWSLPSEIITRASDTELRIELFNGSVIEFKSGEVLDRLRGAALNGVVIDEVRDQDSRLWPLVIRPMLSTTKGWAIFCSTPAGFDSFYDLYEDGKRNPEEWDLFHAPSTDNPMITQSEIESFKRSLSEAEFAQEILAEFRDLTKGKAYVNFHDGNIHRGNPFAPCERLNEFLPIHVGMDFNLSPMAWTLSQKKGSQMHFFDEVFIPRGNGTAEAAHVLVDKVKGHRPGIVIVGDSTARAGQRAAAAQSDYDILCQVLDDAGIRWTNLTPTENPRVRDRVNTVNARLKSASGEVFITVDPDTCPHLVKDFQRVTWKESNDGVLLDQKTDPMLTHASDGAGYLICQTLPISSASSKPGTLSVILR